MNDRDDDGDGTKKYTSDTQINDCQYSRRWRADRQIIIMIICLNKGRKN